MYDFEYDSNGFDDSEFDEYEEFDLEPFALASSSLGMILCFFSQAIIPL